jgi:hypothetical protein
VKNSTKLKIFFGFVAVGVVVAVFEYIGLATPWWHSISYYSQNHLWVFLVILALFAVLPFVWIWHITSHKIPK